jgi:hypothetical protein
MELSEQEGKHLSDAKEAEEETALLDERQIDTYPQDEVSDD